MLVRSAGRRQQQRRTSQLLAASFAQLNLPWLAPAQCRWTASQATPSSQRPHRARRRNGAHSSWAPAQHRSLATTTDTFTVRADNYIPPTSYTPGFRNAAQDRHIPFDFTNRAASKYPTLPHFNKDPIVLNTETQSTRPDRIKVAPGFSGTIQQLLTHLHTSFGVGRRDRAEAIVHRLTEQCGPEAPETIYAHTAYLEDMLRKIIRHGRTSLEAQEVLQDMQKWFEVELRQKGVALDAKLLIVMIRAAIESLDGSRRDRTIRRYADLSEQLGPEAMLEVLRSEDYSDNEFVVLERATQEYYQEPEAGQEQDDEQFENMTNEQDPAERQESMNVDSIPEVLPTGQKGGGLANVKRTMDALSELPSLTPDASPNAHREAAEAKQRRLEQNAVEVAIDRWRKADEDLSKLGIHTAMQSKPVGALMWQWHQSLLPALEEELEEVKKVLKSNNVHKGNNRAVYGPYLELLPLRQIAANTILFTMSQLASARNHSTGGFDSEMKVSTMTTGLAKSLEGEWGVVTSVKKRARKSSGRSDTRRLREESLRLLKDDQKGGAPPTTKSKRNAYKLASLSWDMDVKVKLGAMLISKLIESAQLPVTRTHPRTGQKVTQLQPAFLHRMKYSRGKKLGMVVPNPALMEKMQSEPVGSLIAKRMPMVVEPRPWQGWDEGGYLYYPNPILRLPQGDKTGKDYFMAADERKELDTIYKGLSALGKTPWKVNADVFRVQLEAWNSGEQIANFAPLHPELETPPEPESSSDANARRQWLQEVRDIENKRSSFHSQRCFQNFQLEIARAMLNEKIYFPHNMDFRGRAYPIPPYLNHMGADNVRGLLTFAEGKPLGENGLRWLKIHLATVSGHDKASLEERVRFTEAHMEDIRDSVRDPLGGNRWWLKAEDAWQNLAACFELVKALDSPDPSQFVSSLPVQQDGTCNGLQHYAALGGDKAGAAQVNLEPGDRPADVYSAVMQAVVQEVAKDAEMGDPLAQKLNGRLTRKCVKQPVMTNVYGVTFYGARQQVARQLDPLFPEVHRRDVVNINAMAHYVATKIFKSLGTMFAGAQAIQGWLGQCAERISTCITPEQIQQLVEQKSKAKAKAGDKQAKADVTDEGESAGSQAAEEEGAPTRKRKPKKESWDGELRKWNAMKSFFKSTVVWTTPLRLPVVQPYRSSKARIVYTSMQTLALIEPKVWDPVSKQKQLQAFPPNFIHSLDATHMLMSALKCSENDITFASIHDSFWTHACDVNRMGEILRDAFVAMHSEDIVGRLREEFQTRYKGCMYLAAVPWRSPLGQKIVARKNEMKADAKLGKRTELDIEAERLRLLESENPRERKKGEAMVTPASIFCASANINDVEVPGEILGQRIGEIPNNLADLEEAMNPDADETAAVSAEGAADGEEGGTAAGAADESVETSDQSDHDEGTTRRAPSKYSLRRKIFVWLPLTFPEVPKKGDFDVSRLRESRYFFH